MKPYHTLLTLLAVTALCALTMCLVPKEGIRINDSVVLEFPNMEKWLAEYAETDTLTSSKEEQELYLETLFNQEEDTLKLTEEAKEIQEVQKDFLKIKMDTIHGHPLSSFFAALDDIASYGKVRVLHFGDSQIEGDRISGFLRNELQKKYGGQGCGFLPVSPVSPSFALRQDYSDNWRRHTLFGRKDTTVKHNKYGMLASFCTFETVVDSLAGDSIYEAWVSYKHNNSSYRRNSSYKQVKVYLENNKTSGLLTLQGGGVELSDSIRVLEGLQILTYEFESSPKELKFVFRGKHSPDIYGISFESKSGLYLDNVAMRGNSGTVFRKMDRTLLTEMVQEQNVGLYILQYGGNVVPYLKDSVGVEKYGKWFESQVKLLKQIAPQASILMIGPSDMSERIDGEMTTRPWVVEVNDAMREVAFRNGAAYWDLFQVMGGKNSMVTWVESDPPLAASDYTHFTPRGARQVSELLVQSLEEEQDKWKEAQKKNLKEDDIHAHK